MLLATFAAGLQSINTLKAKFLMLKSADTFLPLTRLGHLEAASIRTF